jgi:UDP-N-acetyl-D-mannosaminouronate:lipid I N-acetyl-D-mannosaminouronosyltransferase
VVDSVVKKLRSEYPEINIAGYRDGFLSASDIQQLEQDILSIKPDVIFVAQGSPRQEKLMSRLQAKHQAIYMGLGGSFDVYTGKIKRAPVLFRNNGLEWLYRLISEPSRIKRQIVLVPFAFRLLLQRFD